MRNIPRLLVRARGYAGLLLVLGLGTADAKPREPLQYTSQPDEIDAPLAPRAAPSKTLSDTVWIADWSFDAPGGGCTSAGWTVYDNRVRDLSQNYWVVDDRFRGLIGGKAAVLSKHDLCWARDGYGNDWDFSLILQYSGPGATLAFDGAWDTEPGFDFVTVEADSLGLSESRVDGCTYPSAQASDYRVTLVTQSGFAAAAHWGPMPLPDFGPGVHEVYVRFHSDAAYSDEDGDYPSYFQAALVTDNIVVTGGLAYSEDFEGTLSSHIALANSANTATCSTAPWARLFPHVTDNDKCVENVTCSWLASDPTLPAYTPEMAFGPGGAVVRHWIDDVVEGPWVSLGGTPSAVGTVLSYRRFLGTSWTTRITHQWAARSRYWRDNPDTPAPGDSVYCVSPWFTFSSFALLTPFVWATARWDLANEIAPDARELQVRFRVVDMQRFFGPPVSLNPGPDPYWDRVRIGRRVLTGPVITVGIDTRTQAQDAFPTVQNAIPGGEHFSPDGSNRFGSCAFSEGTELGINGCCTALITGDSIVLESVTDARGAGGIASVKFFGAITSGPHAGKAPVPYAAGGNGFFEVNAEKARNANGVIVANRWFVDLDDTYFRGGDVLKYVWVCADNSGGVASSPVGLAAVPASVAQAESDCAGLYEVSYLPAINWAPAYLARVAADAHGDLEPDPTELAASQQQNCILYYQKLNGAQRSGPLNRTSFMYTLDQMGYAGRYDVYDVQGYGNTNNQLGSRANVAQCSGYALIIQDDGRSRLYPNVPDGSNTDNEKINQALWYRQYLAQGVTSHAGRAAVWLLGEDTAAQTATNPLFTTDFGLSNVVDNQSMATNPDVLGTAGFTWATGGSVNFTGDLFALQGGGCPSPRVFDGAAPAGTAVATHRYRASGGPNGPAAVILNKNAALQWNTVWMGFPWFDIRDPAQSPAPDPGQQELLLAGKILNGLLPPGCGSALPPTDTGDPSATQASPERTALHANTPNPFNPVTTIRFDVAQPAQVGLRVYDVSGRLVRTLVNEPRAPGAYTATWNGSDTDGRPVASGVYFYRLEGGDFVQTRKMALLK